MRNLAITTEKVLLRLDGLGRIVAVSPDGAVPAGRTVFDLVVPAERAHVEALLATLRAGQPVWSEVTLALDGRARRYQCGAVPGDFGTSAWLLHPLPEPAEVPWEDERELERWLGAFIVEQVEIGSLIFDRAGYLRYRNTVALRLLAGDTVALPVGSRLEALEQVMAATFVEGPIAASALRETIEHGQPVRQLELERRDGLVVEIDYVPVREEERVVAHVIRLRDITQRRAAERRAATFEARYRELVELLPVVVYRAPADAIAETSYVSPQIEQLLGYTVEEWLAQSGMWYRHLHPDDRDRVVAAIEQAVAGGREFSLEYRMVRRDGSVVWVQDWGRVQRDDRGGRFIHGVMLDITERKQAELARAEAERRLAALVTAMPAVVFVVDAVPVVREDGVPTYSVRYVNEYFETLTGYPASALYEQPGLYAELVHPEDRARYAQEALRTDETGELFDLEYRLVRRDGRVIWVRERAVLLRDEQGKPAVWQGLIVDVTQQKETEQALREAEERYRRLVEQLPGALLVARAVPTWLDDGTPAFEFLYASPQIERLTGYPAAAWYEPGLWLRVVHPDDRQHVLRCLERCLESRQSHGVEYRLIRADGQTIWIRHEATLIMDEAGEPLYWQSLLLDRTAEKQAEEALREAEERFRLLAEHHPAAVTIVEPEPVPLPDGTLGWRTQYASPRIVDFTGYTAEEWSELGVWMRNIHPEDRERVLAEARRWYTVGPSEPLEYRFRRKDGRLVWFRQDGALVRDANGKPRYLYLITLDITEQRELLEQLRLAEERYRTLVEQLPGAVLIRPLALDRATHEQMPSNWYVSPAIERLTGFSPEEWTPERFVQQLHPEDRERVLTSILDADRQLAPISIEYRLFRKDGLVVWVWSISHVIRAADGTPLYRQVLLTDVTERKRAEEALRAAEAHYRTLVEQLPAAVVRVAAHAQRLPDGLPGYETSYVSPQIEAVTGFSPEEWKQPGIWARQLHPEDRDWVLEQFWQHEETGEPLRLEYRFLRKDGETVWLWHEVRAIRGPDGAIEARQAVLLDVTERKRIEEALRAAEERFRMLVEQIPAALVILDPHPHWLPDGLPGYRTLYASPRIFDLTGYTPEEWAQLGILARSTHPDDRPALLEFMQRVEATGEPASLEYRFVCKDGRVVWHRLDIWPIRGADGSVLQWHLLMLDITRQKEAERALREAEERYRNLVEQLPAVVYVEGVTPVRHPNGRLDRPLLYVSPRIEELTGHSAEAHQRDRSLWKRAIHPDDYQRVRQETREAWATGRFHSEFRIAHRDGSVRWLESTARLIRDADGKPVAWQGVMLDVTERKRIENELRVAEERYRSLVEQIPAAVIVTAAQPVLLPDGTLHYPITYVSPRIEEVTGFTPEEFETVPGLWFSRMHPEDQPRVFVEAQQTDETGEPFQVTFRWQRKDGRWVWLENRAVMLRDAQGQPLFWHGLLIDVTEQKRAEQLLVTQTTLLRLIAEGAPLSGVLELLCRLVEDQAPGLRCSVLLLGSDGRLRHGAAPSLPPEAVRSIDGLAIGPLAGSCGTAAYLNQPVYVSDTRTDPRWADWRHLAERFDLGACWSTPIRDAHGNVLGTVALYASEARAPRPEEERLLELATQIAALALEHWRETEELRHRAFHDPLTGLPNRLLFLDRLEHALARAERDGGIAVLFVDLDDFKRINDTWGHGAGDLVLQEVAHRLARSVRAGDTVARFAGDEFTVLLEGVSDPDEVRGVAERLIATLAEPIAFEVAAARVSVSVGAALGVGSPLPDSGTLLLAADQALYRAKRCGKCCAELVVLSAQGDATSG
ncbi:PAS domain-containing protein [Thermomicrobium sp. 4228-Ro]|uniref:PAS domain-containing protein n=1 Tax=Thermomicrobium sp. 4228-Ro TaxID=2993937 RepID=UPI0022490E36|nr:PAS domain-containing protein [Thermomicrobium sp. 4228-Ro]MCX2726794.1 PAS domain-containing protein [Thermomicrobium sp. 4228-Ro]